MKTKRQVKSRYINVNIINYKKDLIKLMFSTFSSHVPQKNQAGVHDPHPALGLLTQQHPHSAKMKKKKKFTKKNQGSFCLCVSNQNNFKASHTRHNQCYVKTIPLNLFLLHNQLPLDVNPRPPHLGVPTPRLRTNVLT